MESQATRTGEAMPCRRRLVAKKKMSSAAREVAEDSKAVVAPLFVMLKVPSPFITLKVVDQNDNRIRHTMRRTEKLQVLKDAWYSQVPDVQYGTGTFWLEEICVAGSRTPEQLKMQDGDLIEFFEEQIGGGLVA